MKKIFAFFVFSIAIAAFSTASAQTPVKIGHVDMNKALNESESGKKAKSDLEFLIKSKQTSLDEKGKAIEKAKADFDKQASVLSADAKKSKEEELERMLREYQRLVADSQSEVKKKEGDLTGDILKEIRVVIQKIGQEEGYTMILEGSSDTFILYSQKDSDLTDRVLKKYNDDKTKAKK